MEIGEAISCGTQAELSRRGNDELGEQFGLINMPLTLLIDRNGKIAESHPGVVDKDTFEIKIRNLLRENAVN